MLIYSKRQLTLILFILAKSLSLTKYFLLAFLSNCNIHAE